MPHDEAWDAIAAAARLESHDFSIAPLFIDKDLIKDATRHFARTGDREVRLLCKHDSREDRPRVFRDNGLFLLPTKNGQYCILRGEGYVDIPVPPPSAIPHRSALGFRSITAGVGDSEMQHVDMAFAVSIIRTFMNDPDLVLLIRGRKYTPKFKFRAGGHEISAESVQTEVDAGYESGSQIVLVEAKQARASNTIIRQLYFPFRQWSEFARGKPVSTVFFAKDREDFLLWKFEFADVMEYESIQLVDQARYRLQ